LLLIDPLSTIGPADAVGVTWLDGADGELVPTLFVAVTVKV
jgi:hypothetical protein